MDGKRFFDTFINNKEEAYENIIEMGRNNNYITGNLLDYEYFLNHYKLIAIVTATGLETTSLAKWFSVCLQTKWLWIQVQLQSLKLQISHLFSWHSGNYRVWIHSETRT